MANLGSLNSALVLSCITGIGLSYYSLSVKTFKEQDENYLAMCDISEHMSCSKVFMSEYGKGFGLVGKFLGKDSVLNQSNSLGGIVFYAIVALLSVLNSKTAVKIQLGFCVLSIVASVYLAYILYFILYDFCVVCVSTYVVNLINLVLTIAKLQIISGSAQKSSSHSKKKKKKTN